MNDFRPAIRRALNQDCVFDFLHVPKHGRSGTRPMIHRLRGVFADAKKGDRFNAPTLAKKFGVCSKTIYRDLNFLRDSFGLQLKWNYGRKSFEVINPIPKGVR